MSEKNMMNLKQVMFPSLLSLAVFLGDLDKLKCLEGCDADLNASDYNGKTALHVASSCGQHALVEWLLEKGISVNARDNANETPLLAAVKSGQHEIIKVTISKHNRRYKHSTLSDTQDSWSSLGSVLIRVGRSHGWCSQRK